MSSSPSIEFLESRIAPATFIVTNLADSGEGSLRQAILDANERDGADIIRFKSGLSGMIGMSQGQMNITDDLKILGPRVGQICINGENEGRIFEIDDSSASEIDVTLARLTLTAGYVPVGAGGAIKSVEHTTLKSCFVNGCGGNMGTAAAIDIQSAGGIFITDCEIVNNEGRGLNLVSDHQIRIEHCVISKNFAGGLDAKITSAHKLPSLFLSDSVVSGNGNSTQDLGGARLINEATRGTVVVEDSQVFGNIGQTHGGLVIEAHKAVLSDSQVSRNDGAGVIVSTISTIIENSRISGNRSTLAGGGLQAAGVRLLITGSEIEDNHSTGSGGGIFALIDDSIVIRDSTLAHNTADGNGGGASLASHRIVLDHTFLDGNIASYTNRNSYASAGGADLQGDIVRVLDSVVKNNSSTGEAGGLRIAAQRALVDSSLITKNTAGSGGGLFLKVTDNLPRIANTIVTKNYAQSVGGIYSTGNVLFAAASIAVPFGDCTVTNNLSNGTPDFVVGPL